MDPFEEKLTKLTKPEVIRLEHGELLCDALIRARDRSALSWWWLVLPLYVIAALLMKSYFMPGAALTSNLKEWSSDHYWISISFFVAVPVVLMVLNIRTLRQIYRLAGNPKIYEFFRYAWFHILIILLSTSVLFIDLIWGVRR